MPQHFEVKALFDELTDHATARSGGHEAQREETLSYRARKVVVRRMLNDDAASLDTTRRVDNELRDDVAGNPGALES